MAREAPASSWLGSACIIPVADPIGPNVQLGGGWRLRDPRSSGDGGGRGRIRRGWIGTRPGAGPRADRERDVTGARETDISPERGGDRRGSGDVARPAVGRGGEEPMTLWPRSR